MYLEILKQLERLVNERKIVTGHCMQKYRFGKKCISNDAAIATDPEFEIRVVKIQSTNHQGMTDNENRACSHLNVMNNSNINEFFIEYEDSEKSNDSFSEYFKQVEKPVATKSESQYINCNFILGNAAKVERLWNTAGYTS